MATTYTPNFNLGKQEDLLDRFDMSVITRNADIIDEELHKRSTDTENEGKYLGKAETATAAVKDGAGGNIAAQFASIYGLGTLIPSNSDLNDSAYIVPGVYRAASNAVATSLQNCPVKRGFRLEVREIIYSGIVVRTIYPHTPNGEFYMQYVTSDGFGKWYKFIGEEVATSTASE